MGNGSLSKRKPILVESKSRNSKVIVPAASPIAQSDVSQEKNGTLRVEIQSPVADSLETSSSERSERPPSGDRRCRLTVATACGTGKDSSSLAAPTSISSTAGSQVRSKSGISQRTVDPPPTDTSSGISSLYAMDVENGTGVDDFPEINSSDAPSVGATRLRVLLNQLERGEMPCASDLKDSLAFAASVLEHVSRREHDTGMDSEEEDLPDGAEAAVSEEVRDWLQSTFTRRQSSLARRGSGQTISFRGVLQVVRVMNRMNTLGKHPSIDCPQPVRNLLERVNCWSFDVFSLNLLSENHPLLYLGYEILGKYDLITKFKISVPALKSFLEEIEKGYNLHNTPYHNAIHAADVTQAMHSLLWETGLKGWLTDLEVFSSILAAIIHDFEHTGTTNAFHVQCKSELALLYNDKSVLENHHLSAAFKLMTGEKYNILSNLSSEDFSELRALVIEMVLATDMSSHSHKLNATRSMIATATGAEKLDKTKSLSLCLHCCDLGHPMKALDVHERFTDRLMEEFFLQGDREKELDLPCSLLCDRSSTLKPESQVGFIDFIVKPSFEVLKDMLDVILPLPTDSEEMSNISEVPHESDEASELERRHKHVSWMEMLTTNCRLNRDHWKSKCAPPEVDHSSGKDDVLVVESNLPETSASDAAVANEDMSKSDDAKAHSTVSPPSISRRDSDFAKKKAAAAREEAGRPRLTEHSKSPTKPKIGRQGSSSSKSGSIK